MAPARPSLEDLPTDLVLVIVGRLAASSRNPMEDLRNLRAACKKMRWVCKSGYVSRSVALLQAFRRLPIAPPNVDDLRAHFDSLEESPVGNTEGCFRKGMRIMFRENNGSLRSPLVLLDCAANDGHNLAAYTLAMCRATEAPPMTKRQCGG
ncbi:unnamed protein product [Urochloa humidicola]